MLDVEQAGWLKLKDVRGLEARLADSDDAADATIRLEEALERIAALARHPAVAGTATPDVDTARIAARLDGLIAQIRAALGGGADR